MLWPLATACRQDRFRRRFATGRGPGRRRRVRVRRVESRTAARLLDARAARCARRCGHAVDGADAAGRDRDRPLAGQHARRHRHARFDQISDIAARDHRRLRPRRTDRRPHCCARNAYAFTALESSVEQVDFSRQLRQQHLFRRPEPTGVAARAGVDKAEVFVLATDDPETNMRTARIVRRMYPHSEDRCARTQSSACLSVDGHECRAGGSRDIFLEPGNGAAGARRSRHGAEHGARSRGKIQSSTMRTS